MNKNSELEFQRSTSLINNPINSNNNNIDKKYTLQNLLTKITKSDPYTIGNSYLDLNELFTEPQDCHK